MREECCGDIWYHKHYLFCMQFSIHQLSEVIRLSEKAAGQSKLLAAFIRRECQGHSINIQTSFWSLSPPSLIQLLLREWQGINIFYDWKKST